VPLLEVISLTPQHLTAASALCTSAGDTRPESLCPSTLAGLLPGETCDKVLVIEFSSHPPAPSQVVREVLARTSSGGFCGNDGFMHMTLASLPFGGVGRCLSPPLLFVPLHGQQCYLATFSTKCSAHPQPRGRKRPCPTQA
jgi:hypothetical protein